MFKVNWTEFAEREFSHRIMMQLNDLIEKKFSEDRTLNDNLSHLTIQSLNFGNTSPTFKIINLCEAPDERIFESKRLKLLHKLQLQFAETKDSTLSLLPQEFANASDLGPSNSFKNYLQHYSKSPNNNEEDDKFSILSASSNIMAAMLKQQLMEVPNSPTNSSKIVTTTAPPLWMKTPQSVPSNKHMLSSLEKPLLPTHICSIGTIYKKKKKHEKIVQTKRRSEWWKKRSKQTKGTVQLNVLESAINIPEQKDASSIEQPSIEQPSIEQPSIEQPSIDRPSIDRPSIDRPSIDQPSIEQPSIDESSLEYILGNGVMITMRICYDGNASLQLSTQVLVNVPVPKFITLPIQVILSHLSLNGQVTIIYRPATTQGKKQRVQLFFTHDDDEQYMTVLKDISMIVSIGAPLLYGNDNAMESSVYTDRGKIESLVKELIQYLVHEKATYPNIIEWEQ